MKNLVLLELNELNLDVVQFYLERGVRLPGFNKLLESGLVITEAESEYDHLEPWIQWPSVHTGKKYAEHKIFRLGDFVNSSEKQIFEKIEKAGFKVGAISPMNAVNKLETPAYFIPDPWTKTQCDDSFFSKCITKALVQAVNDNSKSKLTLQTIFSLIFASVALVRPRRYLYMAKYVLSALGVSWRKALFLDMMLYEFHRTLFKKKKVNFSTLFLNAGAHIQHHYFFNSPFLSIKNLKNPDWYIQSDEDPILEMLRIYDEMLLDLLSTHGTEVIVATGLSQKPYESLKFYYRLKDHERFLKYLEIEFSEVFPRMTRDFLISFESNDKALAAEMKLSSILLDNQLRLFEEIDNRGKDIYVVLSYPYEIDHNSKILFEGRTILLYEHVTFVAIKNGEHQSKGFAYFSDGVKRFAPSQGSHVSAIHSTVLRFFDIIE